MLKGCTSYIYGAYQYPLSEIAADKHMYLFYMFAAGYLFEDYDYLFASAANAGGASSIYRVATMVTYLRNDMNWIHHADIDAASLSAYGHTYSYAYWFTGLLDPDNNYLNAWQYYLMWGTWYQV